MAHKEQQDFCLFVKQLRPESFYNKKVLDCGSLDINGNNQYLFTDCEYTGVDLGEGPNVDIVSPIHKLTFPRESFDTIISTECFEHDTYYIESVARIIEMLKPKGLFVFTCATTGRPEHGTTRTSPTDAPFTNDYYKNLTEEDFAPHFKFDEIFKMHQFYVSGLDLQFWGVKK